MKLLLSAVFFSTCSAFVVLPKGRPSLTVKVATDDALFGKKKKNIAMNGIFPSTFVSHR